MATSALLSAAVPEPALLPFVRVTELWVPSADGGSLVYAGGNYGPLTAFREESERISFKPGEGLPGKAWSSRQPIVLHDLANSYFLRKEAAAAAGLNCGFAFPLFVGGALSAVLAFYCGSDRTHIGAAEVWKYDPRTDTQIGLLDGYYGHASLFEWSSRNIKFGRGVGLPGIVWQTDMPVLMPDIYEPGRFLRHKEALKVGLNVGVGIPIACEPGVTYVLTLLSANSTPIARRFEIWTRRPEGGLEIASATCQSGAKLAESFAGADPSADGSFIADAYREKKPVAAADFGSQPAWLKSSLAAAGLDSAIALPLFTPEGEVKAMVCWYS